jgi:hypothetical protein
MKLLITILVFSVVFTCGVLVYNKSWVRWTNNNGSHWNSQADSIYVIDVVFPKGTSSFALEDIEEAEVLSMHGISGKEVATPWMTNRPVFLPLDKIIAITTFSNKDTFLAAIASDHDRK